MQLSGIKRQALGEADLDRTRMSTERDRGADPPRLVDGRATSPERGTAPTRMKPMSSTKTILVVDDEPRIVELARDYLEHAGFAVLTASDGASALATARTRSPDLVVLDLGLPGLDGLDVTRQLRSGERTSDVPIVMLTARDDELDKLLGLELGADDYLTKPFSPRELVARVRAVLRRVDRPVGAGDLISVGDLTLDMPRMRTEVAGRTVDLTPTEFTLLATLARQPGRIFTRSQLLDALHGIAFESYERAIDSHVKNLRRKLEPEPRQPRYVLTVYGVGYRLADDRATDA
jgi:DNA-binding response OmpR family regulator